MNLSLKAELEEFVQQEINKGKYTNPNEVIEAALNLLSRQNSDDRWKLEIGEKIDVAITQIDRGEGLNGDEVFASLRSKLQTAKEER